MNIVKWRDFFILFVKTLLNFECNNKTTLKKIRGNSETKRLSSFLVTIIIRKERKEN